MRALLIAGTRPEIVKLYPVYLELIARGHSCELGWSGQQADLGPQTLNVFGWRPRFANNRPDRTAANRLVDVTSGVLEWATAAIRGYGPDVVIVQGDTTTTLAGALAAFYSKAQCAHVEAGLRTHNRWSPYPEEMNRALVDRLCDILIPPTEEARSRLEQEGLLPSAPAGNTELDAVRIILQRRALREVGEGPVLITVHRRENAGRGAEEVARAVDLLAEASPERRFLAVRHPNAGHNAGHCGPFDALNRDNLKVVPPMPFDAFVAVLYHSPLVITDSGGIQESAAYLHVPLIVCRESTERPEGVQAGCAWLVPPESGALARAALSLLREDSPERAAMKAASCPYGDGYAAVGVVSILEREVRVPVAR